MITSLPSDLSTYVIIVCLLTCVKYLLVTSSPDQLYRSTDFDVHRNWLAVTRHLPVDQWYYDDVGGTTVHTLDYPPGFAYFEYVLGNNPITNHLLSLGWLDERCFALLPDHDNNPSDSCVKFQRMTVLLADVALYVGAWLASHAVNPNTCNAQKAFVSAVLIVANPGLFLLDHIHFQYNAMLLGILLLSIWCLARGAATSTLDSKEVLKWDLLGAFFYALLLGMKHLYLLLGPVFFVYLLRHTCFVPTKTTKKGSQTFSLPRFTALALITGTTLVLPYVPILLRTEPGLRVDQLLQIFRRLFPYQRGLVHSYWAGNIWAVYVFGDKCIRFVLGRVGLTSSIHLPDVPPSLCAILLLIALLPAMQQCWKAATAMLQGDMSSNRAASFFVTAVGYSSLTGFMLSYHCHEKAILTCIIPLSLLSVQSKQSAKLYLRISSLGHFGILPLLFRPAELGLKTCVYISFLALSVWLLKMVTKDELESMNAPRKLTNKWDRLGLLVLLMCFLFMELIHPTFLSSFERLAFLPLLLTSMVCALGLIACWPITFLHLNDAAMSDSERKKVE